MRLFDLFLLFLYWTLTAAGKLNLGNQLKIDKIQICLFASGVGLDNFIPRTTPPLPKYTELNYQWNLGNYTIYPLAYFIPQNSHHVQIVVQCCQKHKIRLVSRSGGHSFMKYSFGDSKSIVVDLQLLNLFTINKTLMTVDIGPAFRLGQVAYKLWTEGRFVLPTGECPQVGISGISLGGGVGSFARVYGLTTDNILELEMVDARGNLLKINKDTNPDLLWAHQGGGGGNFGIVTRFKFRVYKPPPTAVFANLLYPVKEFTQFYIAYQNWASQDPDGKFFSVIRISKDGINLTVTEVQYNSDGGGTTKNVEKILSSFPQPSNSSIQLVSYEKYLVLLANNLGSTPDVTKLEDLPRATKRRQELVIAKSAFVDKVLNSDELRQYSKLVIQFIQKYQGALLTEMFGGAISEKDPSETAFVHRKMSIFYLMQITTKNANVRDALKRVHQFYEASKTFLNHTESYQNYLEPGMPDYLQRFYGVNLPRLIKIKKKIDPKNFFRNPMSIPTA